MTNPLKHQIYMPFDMILRCVKATNGLFLSAKMPVRGRGTQWHLKLPLWIFGWWSHRNKFLDNDISVLVPCTAWQLLLFSLIIEGVFEEKKENFLFSGERMFFTTVFGRQNAGGCILQKRYNISLSCLTYVLIHHLSTFKHVQRALWNCHRADRFQKEV